MKSGRFTDLKNEGNPFKQGVQKYKKSTDSKQSNKYVPPSKKKKNINNDDNNFRDYPKAKQKSDPTFNMEQTDFPELGKETKKY